ncbi:MAG TPA: DUF2268 domain-containing putative Zn-dependent protease [Streptosporangiaceae bacterium]|jgi:hypothetical protein
MRQLPRPIGRLAASAALAAVLAGCAGHGDDAPVPVPSGSATFQLGPGVKQLRQGRFTVVLSDSALQQARADGFSLPQITGQALAHTAALLPGPRVTITIGFAAASQIVPQTGTGGFTDPRTGRQVMMAFGPALHVSASRVLTFWLPRTLALEVDHTVRIIDGPGAATTLLQLFITGGVGAVFDRAAFPGPVDPWAQALTARQQCTLWRQARPLLGDHGSGQHWMLGGDGVPHWAGFSIGYQIVRDYLLRHPHVSWRALTLTSASVILTGSHYQPCG